MQNKCGVLLVVFFVILIGCNDNKKADNFKNEDLIVKETAISPNEMYVCRYYTIEGGGGSGYILHFVNIQENSESFNQKAGIVFHSARAEKVLIAWKSNRELSITCSTTSDVFVKEHEYWIKGAKIDIHNNCE